MTRALWMLLALLGLAGCAADPYGPNAQGVCPLVRVAEMPLGNYHNLMFIDAQISGQTVRLIVDTGAERTILTQAAAERLHLPRDYQHATRTFGIGGLLLGWDVTLPDGMVLGGTHLPVDRVSVGEFQVSGAVGGEADGLLGADILLAFDLDLNLPAHQLTMYRARRECPDAPPPWHEPYVALNGIGTQHDRLSVPFELDGTQGVAVLDTGAQVSSVSDQMVARMGLTKALATDHTIVAHGAAPQTVSVPVHQFKELRIGPAVMNNPVLPVVPISGGIGDALVGADFLRGRRVWLSFSTHRVLVTPIQSGPTMASAAKGP